MSTHTKVRFPLPADDDGWRPAVEESLWAQRTDRSDEMIVDNTPFFIRGIAWRDRIRVNELPGGALEYAELVAESGHSTVRVLVIEESELTGIGERVTELGCTAERVGAYPQLLAVDVPPLVDYRELKAWLDEREGGGVLGYEEGCISTHHRKG